MQTIIDYMAGEFIKKLADLQLNFYRNPTEVAEFVLETRKETDELARRFVQEMIEEMDEIIKRMPERKKNWVVERSSDSKKMITSVGDIVFQKTLYESKYERDEDGKLIQCYLLDKVMGFEQNQSMTEDAMAKIYEEAVQSSYRKGGEAASPQGVSKGAVKNLLHKTKYPKNYCALKEKKQVKYLYIDADEDHYHLQFQNQKGDLIRNEKGRKCNGAINKLIYVFEDIVPEAPKSKRNRLVNTHYFCRGTEQDNKELWKEVFAYIEATYDVEAIEKIYINADGGQWIKTGYDSLIPCVFVLDEFHISQSFVRLTSHMKDSQEDAINELRECLKTGSRKKFERIVERLEGCTESESVYIKIEREKRYLLENWTAAKYRLKRSEGIKACSAEGHVYHVLSSRMSTQAMGWSRHGGSQMARLREYYYNGGNMLELAKYQKEDLPMAAGAEEVVLSANEVVEMAGYRTKEQLEYGKYSEQMKHTIPKYHKRILYRSLRGKI